MNQRIAKKVIKRFMDYPWDLPAPRVAAAFRVFGEEAMGPDGGLNFYDLDAIGNYLMTKHHWRGLGRHDRRADVRQRGWHGRFAPPGDIPF